MSNSEGGLRTPEILQLGCGAGAGTQRLLLCRAGFALTEHALALTVKIVHCMLLKTQQYMENLRKEKHAIYPIRVRYCKKQNKTPF